MSYYGFRPYVSVARRRANAAREMTRLRKKGKRIEPVEIEGRTIARTFWGKAWCDHLESFHDYANRLDRGKRYVRNGSVCHLDIRPRRIEAIVSGSEMYEVTVRVKRLAEPAWADIVRQCSGRIGSMLELLQGKLSDEVMTIVADRQKGLMPQPGQISFRCSCPDWAIMCKHVAAVLYGIGSRLDVRPELLFLLRDVDAEELIAADVTVPAQPLDAPDAIAEDRLGDIFDIELDADAPPAKSPPRPDTRPKAARKRRRKAPVKAAGAEAGATRSGRKAGGTRGTAAAKRGSRASDYTTGSSIRRLRKRLGLSAPQLAATLSVSPGTIYRWESARGRLRLHQRTAEALARLAGGQGA